MEKTIAFSQRENYVPTQMDEFLWWLATAEKEIIADCAVDRNRYKIVGMSVLATWLFATLAWTYFFSTMTDNPFLTIACGLFMGFVILTIDRALIKGINKFNKNKITPLLFRGLLALTIGTFMAQPVVLYMFDKEIKLQTSLDNEKRKQVKRQELDALYKDRKTELLNQKETIQKELDRKYAEVSNSRENFIKETDGSGGSGKVGIKDIAIAKRNEYEKLDGEYKTLLTNDGQKLDDINKELNEMESNIKKEEVVFTKFLNDGFLTRAEALNNLIKANAALQFRYYLIIVILMLIELMPVIAKFMLPTGTYDEKVRLREEMEKQIAEENTASEKEVKLLYNKLAKQADTETLHEFFEHTKEERKEKIGKLVKQWQEEKDGSLDGYWTKVKKNVITKQEN
ncbi:MAG: DUF4407 domain-containing protein [Sphingobacteriales bacterium]|nr:DUF4407 domain-containing protein [Sphingobacteriales bacterium]MBI3718762.1 DUF4407 domain-containing protein [Sphingobacteriales bacterium]